MGASSRPSSCPRNESTHLLHQARVYAVQRGHVRDQSRWCANLAGTSIRWCVNPFSHLPPSAEKGFTSQQVYGVWHAQAEGAGMFVTARAWTKTTDVAEPESMPALRLGMPHLHSCVEKGFTTQHINASPAGSRRHTSSRGVYPTKSIFLTRGIIPIWCPRLSSSRTARRPTSP